MKTVESLTQELVSLVEINSHTYNPQGVNEVGEKIQELLKDCELEWQRFPQAASKYGDLFYARSKNWDRKLPHLALCGHLDTVFKDHTAFNIRVAEGKLFGPGAADMKGGLMVMVETVRRLQASGSLTNLTLILTADEEVQETNAYPVLADLVKEVDYLMVFEGDGSGKPEPNPKHKSLVVERKGFIYSKLVAKAEGGHSGVKGIEGERHSAVHELVLQGAKILQLADFTRQTTVNLGIIKGGMAVNALAVEAELHFDARVVSMTEFARMTEAYDALPQTKFDPAVELHYERVCSVTPLPYSATTRQFFAQAKAAATKLGVELSEEFRGGGSDANRLCPHNENMAVLDNFGPAGGGEHTTDEFLYLNTLEPNIEFTQAVVHELLGK